MTKQCTKCGDEKDIGSFSRKSGCVGGFNTRCKACCAHAEAQRRAACPERTHHSLMVQRCHNERHPKFHLYGGRGIKVAAEWLGEGGFERFFAHIGPKPSPSHEIDRIDNARGYEPGNVRWATRVEQMRNTRRTVLVTAFGRTQSLFEWAKETGIPKRTLEWRRESGWSPEQIVGTPLLKRLA